MKHYKCNVVGEVSLILIDEGKYVGYGYMYTEESIRNKDEAKGYMVSKVAYPDHDDIIKGYLKNKRLKKVVF